MVADYKMRCAEVWVCDGGEFVFSHKRFTLTKVSPPRQLTRKDWGGGWTWSEAMGKIADFAQTRYQPMLDKALEAIDSFRNGCEG